MEILVCVQVRAISLLSNMSHSDKGPEIIRSPFPSLAAERGVWPRETNMEEDQGCVANCVLYLKNKTLHNSYAYLY